MGSRGSQRRARRIEGADIEVSVASAHQILKKLSNKWNVLEPRSGKGTCHYYRTASSSHFAENKLSVSRHRVQARRARSELVQASKESFDLAVCVLQYGDVLGVGHLSIIKTRINRREK